MKVEKIIDSAYTYLHKSCRNNNIIYEGKTAEDILNDIVLQTIRHFKSNEVSWENGFKYMQDTFYIELHFSPKRINREKMLLMEDCKKLLDFKSFTTEEDE